MIALKLVFQSLAGVVAVGGAVGGTVALSNKNTTTKPTQTEQPKEDTQTEQRSTEESTIVPPPIKTTEVEKTEPETLTPPSLKNHERSRQIIYQIPEDIKINPLANETNQDTNDFYLVSAPIKKNFESQTTDLFADKEGEKNYQCIYTYLLQQGNQTTTTDSSCILYSLNAKANTSLKTSEIQEFIKNPNDSSTLATKLTNKEQLTDEKFFLLQGDKNLKKPSISAEPSFIDLTVKNETSIDDETNPFVNLQIHAKIFSNKVTGKTNTIIAKATSNKQTSINSADVPTPTYQCSFTSEVRKEDCTLSKLSGYTSGNPFNFEDSEINTESKTTNTETDSYYLIQSTAIAHHELKDLKVATPKYIETEAKNSTTTQLNFEAVVFANFENDPERLSELIIID